MQAIGSWETEHRRHGLRRRGGMARLRLWDRIGRPIGDGVNLEVTLERLQDSCRGSWQRREFCVEGCVENASDGRTELVGW